VISEATLRDLKLFYPFKKEERFWVIRPGVDHNVFRRSESEKIQKFRAKYDLGNKSFVMFVGARHQKNDYKNSVKFFEALNSEKTFKYNVVCVGGEELLESEIKICTKAGIKLHRLEVLDEELPICYSAATCLVYPSKYEGFGMPVLEALSVGTAVVSGKRGGLIESGGELITPVDVENGNDILRGIELAAASNWASHILKEGPKWAAKFSWKESAELLIKAILTTKESYESLRVRKANEILFDFHSAMKYLE
jgi:glycosyltransferase involved in cell wall biosynthesis